MNRHQLMDLLASLCRRGLISWKIHDHFIDISYPTEAMPITDDFCKLNGQLTTYAEILVQAMKEINDGTV